MNGIRQTFRSLRHRNFRIYFIGQFVSLCGTWMQSLALSWLVYRLTKSAFMLGLVEFANLSPVLFLALAGGWVADRSNRKHVLAWTQLASLIQASVLAYLTLTHQIQIWHILILALMAGIINAFEIPSRQSLIVQMVERKDLVNAISLNSSLFNGTRIMAPALAALLIQYGGSFFQELSVLPGQNLPSGEDVAPPIVSTPENLLAVLATATPQNLTLTGEGVCFTINACSYLAALIAVLMLRIPSDVHNGKEGPTSVMEGLSYAFRTAKVRRILRLTLLLALAGSQFTVLMPVIAKEVLHSDVQGFGWLRTSAAIGSFSAAILLASRGSSEMLAKGVGIANLTLGIFLVGFALSQNFILSGLLATGLGFCMTFQLSGSHSLLQLMVPDELRGRLMSVWTLMIMGMSPLGSLATGWLGSHYGAPAALLIAAAVSIVSALVYLIFRA